MVLFFKVSVAYDHIYNSEGSNPLCVSTVFTSLHVGRLLYQVPAFVKSDIKIQRSAAILDKKKNYASLGEAYNP